ncbi:SRPBCC family protein [Psychroserpens algicola]|uniref:SRPBCC domain-containing protein n=1 Tax=Psychroserpens algicola TaxID=1719034 RepID=A0ABT0H6J8_9FLAO|nr:SRPBCC domain-containing protein [Psychroserpens algicola]MCK8479802.1 SRPBCC domain-containing protein [Psychroserpens algicola]
MKTSILCLIFTVLLPLNIQSQQKSSNNKLHITEKIITKTATVNCSVETSWWKWSTHEGLKTFFGKNNVIELKPGGSFEIYFSEDEAIKEKGGEGNKILSFQPKKMISFSWNAPPNIPTVRNHEHKTWVVVSFEKIDENQTKVELSHLGWLEGEDWDKAFDYFNQAWPIVMDWFAKSCEQ